MASDHPAHLFESVNLLVTYDADAPGGYQVDYEIVRFGDGRENVFVVEGANYVAHPDLDRPSLLLAALVAWLDSKI